MKVLIIDRDAMFSNLLASKIRSAGHEVIETTIKNDGIEQIGTSKVDVVYFDPSPLTDSRSILLQIRRMVHTYPYLVMMGQGNDRLESIRAGCNEGLAKPIDPTALALSLQNAERMCGLIRRIGDESFDFPSAGGVISKSAFNQLFISANDRVSRYGEEATVLFISVVNYDDVKLDDGKYAADYAVSRLAQALVKLRRQSDILGQTAVNEYALLLQRAQSATESTEAAKRFSAAMDELTDLSSNGIGDIHIEVQLVQLPSGGREFHRTSVIKGLGSRSVV